ncbi:DNA-deoxyinosine glycosylase [Novosphingobium cyanobacteriorum]|uniref:DNA-deoxyinosine glycosylase n=1 Tax=Novosphingobium cyanobacteriorum TaxID=3024215 RepID=A0ABT6CEV7_9SPHN|nr:DNA-deoxyinosine glycosylase [Novosphingobium cyanobacteriorum]MDF8332341.1 DNA-deoxyinosine glycosylase [Novosphingobium cyanobacteriorum]
MIGTRDPGRKSAFAPVVSPDTRVLVLGSLPGEASLAAGRYYAHPANLFWRLVGGVIQRPDLPEIAYDQRLAVVLLHGIGLWDTVRSAHRKGSLDAALRDVDPAPLAARVASLPMLKAVAFNGAASAKIGAKQLPGHPDLERVQLPSSSPAHARMTAAEKQAHWNSLRKFLL